MCFLLQLLSLFSDFPAREEQRTTLGTPVACLKFLGNMNQFDNFGVTNLHREIWNNVKISDVSVQESVRSSIWYKIVEINTNIGPRIVQVVHFGPTVPLNYSAKLSEVLWAVFV